MKSEFSSRSLQVRVLKLESKSSVQVQAFHWSIQACFIQNGQLRFRGSRLGQFGIKVEVDPSSAQPCIIYDLVWLKHRGELLKGLARHILVIMTITRGTRVGPGGRNPSMALQSRKRTRGDQSFFHPIFRLGTHLKISLCVSVVCVSQILDESTPHLLRMCTI